MEIPAPYGKKSQKQGEENPKELKIEYPGSPSPPAGSHLEKLLTILVPVIILGGIYLFIVGVGWLFQDDYHSSPNDKEIAKTAPLIQFGPDREAVALLATKYNQDPRNLLEAIDAYLQATDSYAFLTPLDHNERAKQLSQALGLAYDYNAVTEVSRIYGIDKPALALIVMEYRRLQPVEKPMEDDDKDYDGEYWVGY